MTIHSLANALRSRRSNANTSAGSNPSIPDEKLVGFYTKCGRCGKSLFMDDRLIVEQSVSAEKFLERCAKRLFEHQCNSDTQPQI